jgi:hypothetical protein
MEEFYLKNKTNVLEKIKALWYDGEKNIKCKITGRRKEECSMAEQQRENQKTNKPYQIVDYG